MQGILQPPTGQPGLGWRVVAVVEDPGRAGGRLLVGPDGTTLARFVERDARTADLFDLEPGVRLADAVPVVLAELRGRRVAGSEALARALVAAGGRALRHAHVYSRDLRRDPAPATWARPAGLTLTAADRPPADLAPAYRSAYPTDHPDLRHLDAPPDLDDELRAVATGEMVGPILACSGVAVEDRTGDVVGAILVAHAPGEPPFGGPWIAELFRHRDRAPAGTGRALLERALALATQDGVATLGLAVTEGNRAERLYRTQGFARVLTSLTVEL